jgi:CBS domain-containing protein
MVRESYKALQLAPIKPGTTCRQPRSFGTISLDAPAIEVMTDFEKVTPATVSPEATLREATKQMISRGVRLLFVARADGVVLGVITARDTMGERPVKLLKERGGRHDDLQVADVMTPQHMVEAMSMRDVLRAEVGHILQTLKSLGRQHALVAEFDPLTGREEIRGMFSATAIGRQLGVPVQTFEVANTFAEIEAALADS